MSEIANPVLPTEVATRVHTRYTDPLDLLEDKITDTALLARVMPSMAWMIDNQIIVAARMFFFEQFKSSEYTGERDGLESFLAAFRGTLDVDAVFGSDGTAGTLVKLLALRQDWHDRADRAMQADGRVYNPRSFDELIANERPQQITSLTKAKQAQIAKFVADGNAEDEKQIAQMLEERVHARNQSNLELNKKVGPAVLELIAFAQRYCEPTRFEHLDQRSRQRFFSTGKKFLKNALNDMATMNSVSEFEFAMMMKEFKEADRAFTFVLDTQYKDDPTPHIRESGERNAKKAAAASDASDYEADVAARSAQRDAAAAAPATDEPIPS